MELIIGLVLGIIVYYLGTKFLLKNAYEDLYNKEVENSRNKDERILYLEKFKSSLEEKKFSFKRPIIRV